MYENFLRKRDAGTRCIACRGVARRFGNSAVSTSNPLRCCPKTSKPVIGIGATTRSGLDQARTMKFFSHATQFPTLPTALDGDRVQVFREWGKCSTPLANLATLGRRQFGLRCIHAPDDRAQHILQLCQHTVQCRKLNVRVYVEFQCSQPTAGTCLGRLRRISTRSDALYARCFSHRRRKPLRQVPKRVSEPLIR